MPGPSGMITKLCKTRLEAPRPPFMAHQKKGLSRAPNTAKKHIFVVFDCFCNMIMGFFWEFNYSKMAN